MQLLSYLKLNISDKEMKDSLTYANAHLSFTLIPVWILLNVVSVTVHAINYLFGKGDAYQVFINSLTVCAILLNPLAYRYKKELCKWVPACYLLCHTVCTTLLFQNNLGPLNPTKKVYYQNSLLINFLISAMVEGNDIITLLVNCF